MRLDVTDKQISHSMLRLEKRKKENLLLKQNHQKAFQNAIASKVTKLLDSNSDCYSSEKC